MTSQNMAGPLKHGGGAHLIIIIIPIRFIIMLRINKLKTDDDDWSQ